MSMFTRSRSRAVATALVAATALTAVAAPAAAQQVDRIVAFGDSYADDNNAFGLGYNNPGALAVYPTGRFSGGTIYIDSLGQILQVPIENFAIGGAFGGTNNGTLCFDPPFGNNLCGKGLQYEVDQFLNVGAQSGVFPTGVAGFNDGDLLAVSIGGNDSRIYQQVGGSLAGAGAAGSAAAVGTAVQLDRLVAAGAPTISFLAGDTGRLPEIAPFPTLAAIRSTFSSAFNSSLRGTLAGYAADGVIVHYLDLGIVLDNIAANPAEFGITSGLVCPIFPNPTCIVNSAGYLFYGDALHLTSDGFKIVARYVAAQLTAPLTLQAPSEASMNVGQQFGRTLTTRLDLSAPRDGDMPEGMHAYIVGDAYSRTIDGSRGNQPFDSDSVGVTVGADYGFGSGVVGIAANYSKPKSNFETGAADVKSDSIQLGAYAGMGIGGGFVQGYVGYGWDNHDIDRRGVIEDMSASPDGNHWIAGAKAGYLMTLGAVRIGPVAGLDYARVRVDSYTEDGDPALTLNVGSTRYKSLRGSIGAELRGDFAGGGVQLRPYGALVLEKELSGGNRSVSFSQTSAPIIVNSFDFENVSKKAYGRGTVGATARILGGVHLDAGISMTAGKRQGNETSGHLGLKASF
ncbi:MAG: autotransporter domain-containing protein [Sphingomonas bacterium]|nr:autotransporter domain-containing protein [Sphingomonas bacterium]